ncbi:MAG: hypothetical protein E7580_07105 [Ruminococcaceae bacterium]|nr:hypothetical protein [Oscillospiraceae bacterium]
MKKFLAVLLAFVMLLSLCACSDKKDNDDEDKGTETEEKKSDKSDDKDAKTEEDEDKDEDKDEEPVSNDYSLNTKVKIEETELYDEDDVTITADKLSFSSYCVELDLTIENESDEDLLFTSDGIAVNGFTTSALIYSEVKSGKDGEASVSIYYDELMMLGIETIGEITLQLEIDDGDYKTDPIHTKPMKLETSESDDYKFENTYRSALQNKKINKEMDREILYYEKDVLFNKESVKLVSQAFAETKDGTKCLYLEFENGSSESLTITLQNLAINGLVVVGYAESLEIASGTHGVMDVRSDLVMMECFFEDLDLDEFSDLSFDLSIDGKDFTTLAEKKGIELKVSDEKGSFNKDGEQVYEADGVTLSYVGLYEEDDDIFEYFYLVFLVENDSGKTVCVEDVYDGTVINGKTILPWGYGGDISDGQSGVFFLELTKSTMKEIGVTKLDDFESCELSLKIRDDDFETLDEPVISLEF